MDFTFTEEQEILRDSARRFIDKEWCVEDIKDFVDHRSSFSKEMWQKIVDLGWTAVLIPETDGGLGLSFVDLAVILEEMGRGPMPGPFISSVVLAGEAIRLAGYPQQKEAYLPKLAYGEIRGTLAWAEPGDLNSLNTVTLTASRSDGSFDLKGTKIFVPDADLADIIICLADTGEGRGLFLVDKVCPGVEIHSLDTMDRTTNLSEVIFDHAIVPEDRLMGKPGAVDPILKQILNRVNVAYSLDMVGGSQRVLDLGVEYAKARVQFGQAIGSFQAIKHTCAELLMGVECARSIAYYAAWAQDQDDQEAALAASAAKTFASETYQQVTRKVLQILGGIGFSWEHELHIYLKRAKCLGALFGDVTYHRERVALELGY